MQVEQLDMLALFEVAAVDAAHAGKRLRPQSRSGTCSPPGWMLYIGMATNDNWSNPSSGVIADSEWSAKGATHA